MAGSTDFLVNCRDKFSCDNMIRLPFDGQASGDKKYEGYSFAPFVELKLNVSGEILTVGNNSRPNGNNTAVITSLEYGASEGVGVIIEIFDEEGGNFTKSFQALNKSLNNLKEDISRLEIDFGWLVEKKCGGESARKFSVKTENKGYPINLLPLKMNVVYEGGKIKYTLEANDMQSRISEVRQECNIGTEDAKVSLKEAIKKFMKENLPPPMLNVEFLKKDGTEWEFKNSDGGPDGPKSVWGSCQQNKLATLRRWIAPYTTKDDKGIILQWKGLEDGVEPKEGGTIILMEDPSPDNKQKNPDLCGSNIGTYIVNGGKLSPVLSFNPQVNWILSGGGSAGASQAGASASGKKAGSSCSEDKNDKGGTASTMSTGGQDNNRSPDQQSKATAKANAAHEKAAITQEQFPAIKAELKIIGDPKYIFPLLWKDKNLSLIVINPIHLMSRNLFLNNAGCPEWLSQPACNPVFSNKNWQIIGVNHQIKGGSYVTILNLMLAAPNVEISRDSHLGGDPNGFNTEIKENKDCGKCVK
jgi:hypothetical protein